MPTNTQKLGFVAGSLVLVLGIALYITNSQPGNLHFSSIAFLFVGPAILALTFTTWLNDRYERTIILVVGIALTVLLFVGGFLFFLWSLTY